MKPKPNQLYQYHVFLASPGDVGAERQVVRRFFEDYNRHTAHIWDARFEVVDWENYATTGVGRPQELITLQTLEKYSESLALVIGIMGLRFGSPTGKAESGTEEEFNWAMESHKASASGFPGIKWFFRKVETLDGLPADPAAALKALEQWQKVRAFRQRMQDLNDPVFYAEYPNAAGFAAVFERDLNQWLADPARPWAARRAAHLAATVGTAGNALPAEFDAESYRAALLKRYDKLNFEMLDTTGAFYSAVRLWSVFVPQSVRECHEYNPRLLEIPKEHQRRLVDAGALSETELEEAERQANQLRQEYFQQPLRAVLDVVGAALHGALAGSGRKLVILGDPGSGKSSLIRYIAVRWAGLADKVVRDLEPVPLVVELSAYARWQCNGRKDFVRYLEEGPTWHDFQPGSVSRLLAQPGRAVLLLDGLDEVFDLFSRESVVNDVQRISGQFATLSIVLTSRVVGYQAQRLHQADFRHFMLQDLDSYQISDFVNRWHQVTFDDLALAALKQTRLQKAIRESKSIAMLAGNPLLLTMMAILNRSQELPRDRAELYFQASRVLLHQWDTERALADFSGISNEIGLRQKTEILRRIAACMLKAPGGLKGNLIDGAALTDVIEKYLFEWLHFPQARAAASSVVEQLRLRNFILCFVGADSYAFVHRTFLEYFCAADVVHQFNVVKALTREDLLELFVSNCHIAEWREILRLVCGQIDESFVGKLIAALLRREDLEAWNGHAYLHGLGLSFVLAAEVRNMANLAEAADALFDAILLVASKAGGPDQSPDMTRQLNEIVAAVEAIGYRWPGIKKRLPVTPQKSRWKGGGGIKVWPRIVVSFQKTEPRAGLIEFAVNSEIPEFRLGAMQTLAEKWPDESTRKLLSRRAVEDDDEETRVAARRELTRLALPSSRGPHLSVPPSSLGEWKDLPHRDVLVQRAVLTEDRDTRNITLQSIVESWPDQATRDLLSERVIQDVSEGSRKFALQLLADKWPDQSCRSLLMQRAVVDESHLVRRTALQLLAVKWPDQVTRIYLAQLLFGAPDKDDRGVAFSSLGKMHSELGRILLTRDLDGLEPFLDPRDPISSDHIAEAAIKAGISPAEIDSRVASLSAHLGFDITVGTIKP